MSPELVRWRGHALLFDLFGTVIHFAPQVPTVEVAESRRRSTMSWLQDAAARELPGVAADALLAALTQVTEEIVRGRPPEYREVPSRERFRRAVLRLGIDAKRAPVIAERLSLTHMDHLASLTTLPAGHAELLHALATRYRLGLISNFDHALTARRILSAHELADCFDPIFISDEFGRRKPHPAIFAAALRDMDIEAADALFIGDSIDDDMAGARNAGLPMVWLNAKQLPLPPNVRPPDYVITELIELLSLPGLHG